MPYDVKSFSVPFLGCGGMDYNLFGDYDTLVKRCYRDQETKAVAVKWFVTGRQEALVRQLKGDEILEALESYFHKSVAIKDEPPVATLESEEFARCT